MWKVILILLFICLSIQTGHTVEYKQILSPNICYLLVKQSEINTEDENLFDKMFNHYIKGPFKIYYSYDTPTLLMINDEIKNRYRKIQPVIICIKSTLSDTEREKYLSDILNKQLEYSVWIEKTKNIINQIYSLLNMNNNIIIKGNKQYKINTNEIRNDIDRVVKDIQKMYNIHIDIQPTNNQINNSIDDLIKWLEELKSMYKNVYLIDQIIKDLKSIK